MAEIIKCFKESFPASRFIGKCYGDADRLNGSFGHEWGEWFGNGWFDVIEKVGIIEEDGGSYIGLMSVKEGKPFQYWIGIFTPVGSEVPDGFDFVDFDASDLGTCWIYGSEQNDNIYGMHDACAGKMRENNWQIQDNFGDGVGEFWFCERYNCPRFTTPDADGKVILDYCFYIK